MTAELPFGNPFADYESYAADDRPWAAALTTGETQAEVFRDVVEATRRHIQQHRLLDAEELDHPTTEVEDKVQQVALQMIERHNTTAPQEGAPLLDGEPDALARRIVDEVLGWGPLSPYMKDDAVEEVILNDYDRGFVIYAGGRKAQITGFHSPEFARAFFNRKIEAGHGYPVNSKNPYQDARLPDGSRLFVQIPAAGRHGPAGDHPPFPPGGHGFSGVDRVGHDHTGAAQLFPGRGPGAPHAGRRGRHGHGQDDVPAGHQPRFPGK